MKLRDAARRLKAHATALVHDRSGLALIEFAYTLPVLLLLTLTGAELTNYAVTRMRISQLALQVADNAARIGSGTRLQAKRITEADINDLFVGAQLQSGQLDLMGSGRVILSSLEQDPSNAGRFRIRWQRCAGTRASHTSTYGLAGDDDLTGMGPPGRQATVADNNATMFVEVFYVYEPLIQTDISPPREMVEFASMMVRDRRDLDGGSAGIYPASGATPSTC